MALVNPNIALSVKPLELQQRNPLAEAAQVMSLQQAQMQMDKIRQTDEAMERIRQAAVKYGGPDDLNEIARAYMSAPDPQHQALGLSILQKQKEKSDFERMGRQLYPELFAAAPAAAAPAAAAAPLTAAAPVAAPANALAPAAAPAAPVNALVAPAAAPTQPLSPSGKTRRELEGIIFLAQQNPLYKGMAETAKLELQELIRGGAPTELQRDYEFAKKQGFVGTLFDYKRKLAEAGRTPAQPSAPVAVVDPDTGRQIYVSREEALAKKMTPASGMEGLTPKEIQKREAALPQAKASVTGFETKTDEYIKDLEKLRDDPGLAQITGAIYGRTPSVSREGSRAQALYNKIFAKGGFQALQDLREASKTGGALGNVSNQEGERLERSIVGGLDRTQNIADVKAGINDLIESLKVSKARVRNTFDETYQYKTERPGAGPAPDPLGIR